METLTDTELKALISRRKPVAVTNTMDANVLVLDIGLEWGPGETMEFSSFAELEILDSSVDLFTFVYTGTFTAELLEN